VMSLHKTTIMPMVRFSFSRASLMPLPDDLLNPFHANASVLRDRIRMTEWQWPKLTKVSHHQPISLVMRPGL
jgi:hypothetical protein